MIVSLLLVFSGVIPVGFRQVSLNVTFKLTDLDYHPLAGVPVRLLFCCDKDWQDPNAGYRFVTDANGEGHVTAPVTLDRRWRRIDSNYIGTLIGLPMLTYHLGAGAELEFEGFHRIYIVQTLLFPEGTCLQDRFDVYTPDVQGRFTVSPERTFEGGWKFKELGGLIVSGPGYQPWDYTLGHDGRNENWTLKLALKKSPPPMRR